MADLSDLGHTTWFDQQLTGGQSWWDAILDNIRNCEVFIFAVSPHSLDSQPCSLEYNYAHSLRKRILPVLIADVNTNLLPPVLAQIQFVDYRSQDKKGPINLVRALNALPPDAPLPNPLPNPPDAPLSAFSRLGEQVEAPALTYEQQAALLLELKEFLHEPDAADEVRQLLETFKNRTDLFARIDREIDDVLKNTYVVDMKPSRKTETFIGTIDNFAIVQQFSSLNTTFIPEKFTRFTLFLTVVGIIIGAVLLNWPFYEMAYGQPVVVLGAAATSASFLLIKLLPSLRLHFPNWNEAGRLIIVVGLATILLRLTTNAFWSLYIPEESRFIAAFLIAGSFAAGVYYPHKTLLRIVIGMVGIILAYVVILSSAAASGEYFGFPLMHSFSSQNPGENFNQLFLSNILIYLLLATLTSFFVHLPETRLFGK